MTDSSIRRAIIAMLFRSSWRQKGVGFSRPLRCLAELFAVLLKLDQRRVKCR